ncbi:unnamed protein product [Rotaria socialis]|uniref:Uncharacterized protein n=1 Tax=Rotaria socialis TaxID=392032 RepID=A0A818V777_9BILA|nr:unnamed protein product [Rotaria socialis]CAF4921623.1 unnamed protein product [Rotaria socialis]
MAMGGETQNINNPAHQETIMDLEEGQDLNSFPFRYLIVSPTASQHQFLNSPIQINIALKNSIYVNAVMDKPIYNKGKGTVIIPTKIKIPSEETLKIGQFIVKCQLLTTRPLSFGVIGSNGPNVRHRQVRHFFWHRHRQNIAELLPNFCQINN